MKRIIIPAIILGMTSCYAQSEEITLPLWKNYCPPRFLDAKVLTTEEFAKQYPFQYIIYQQKRVDDYNKTVEYWQHRKYQFDRFMQTCETFPEDKKAGCYERIRAREKRLNDELTKVANERINDTNAQKAQQPNNHTLLMNNMLRMMNHGAQY